MTEVAVIHPVHRALDERRPIFEPGNDVAGMNLGGYTTDGDLLSEVTEAINRRRATALAQTVNLSRASVSAPCMASLLQLLMFKLLTRLDLRGSHLSNGVAEVLAEWLSAGLEEFVISDGNLSCRGLVALWEAFLDHGVALRRLQVGGIRHNAMAAHALADLLRGPCRHSLQVLEIPRCGLDEITAALVTPALLCCEHLEVLDLTANNAAAAIVGLPSKLRVLRLSGNFAGDTAVADGLISFVVPSCGTLEELCMSGCHLGDKSILRLLTEGKQLPALRILDLSKCQLTWRMTRPLIQRLAVSGLLERLCLCDNVLGVEGASELSNGMDRMPRLTTLHLAGCHVANCGAVSILRSLLDNTASLKELDLSRNDLTDGGICNLFAQLDRPSGPQLERLLLSGNVCSSGSRSLLRAMLRGWQEGCTVVTADSTRE